MTQYVHLLGTEDANRAASRLEDAAKAATNAADRIEEAVRQLRALTDDGYGNNVTRLIELLSAPPAAPDAPGGEATPTDAEIVDWLFLNSERQVDGNFWVRGHKHETHLSRASLRAAMRATQQPPEDRK